MKSRQQHNFFDIEFSIPFRMIICVKRKHLSCLHPSANLPHSPPLLSKAGARARDGLHIQQSQRYLRCAHHRKYNTVEEDIATEYMAPTTSLAQIQVQNPSTISLRCPMAQGTFSMTGICLIFCPMPSLCRSHAPSHCICRLPLLGFGKRHPRTSRRALARLPTS
ncbi:hypothetical protein FVEG_16231 [Fusarium verticillioides 7600]|uniref:Uncharacterized protein n=1 Tax=Gibberella moniliformis (strain M3125 / FGSC 7600) TaxID=334819 RepID=W7MAK3_GIBM7|nr:hypothetical protein FVEG_16231 [Fusarium verticillioides 7600]EWG48041.1 hypothetical protein FVEG_16231 [Fusarium verticillioides 7600]